MQIIESFLKGKMGDDHLCEDNFVFTEEFAVVIDGATAKSDMMIDNKKTGKFISDEIKNAVLLINDKNLNAAEFVGFIETHLSESYKQHQAYEYMLNDKNTIPMASMAVYSKSRHEIWLFADCQALAGQQYRNEITIDYLTSMTRKFFIEYHLMKGKTVEELMEHDLGQEAIMPMLKLQQNFCNAEIDSPFVYSAISGFGYNMKNAKVIPLPTGINEIVLTSDGYPEVFPTLEETETYLLNALQEDPLCYKKIISTKGLKKGQLSYDDRCYLRFTV